MPNVDPSKRFVKSLKKLSANACAQAIDALADFAGDPSIPALNFERVQGKPGRYTIRANDGNRICLRRTAPGCYDAVDVGSHDYIYRKYG